MPKLTCSAFPQHIATYAADVFGRLAENDYLRGRDRAGFLDGIAELWADLNALHPFREGNGRATRAFLAQLAGDAGCLLSWAELGPAANISASSAAHRGDSQQLRDLLEVRIQ